MAESKSYLLPNTQGRYVTVPVTGTSGEVYRINDDGTRTIYADYFVENGNTVLEAAYDPFNPNSSEFSSPEFRRNLAQNPQGYNRTISNSILQANGETNSQPDPNQSGVEGSSVPTNADGNNNPSPPSSATLRYPLNNTGDYDFLKITTYKRVGNITAGDQLGFNLRDPDEVAVQKTGDPVVALPMHPGISDTNSVSWGEDSLNPIQLAGAKAAYETIGPLANMDLGGAASAFMNAAKTTVTQAFNSVDPNMIKSYFAGQAVGANIFTRSTGKVLNPNLELLFRGPQMRSFNYNYTFTPRDPDESKVIRQIIRHFKKNMAVRRSGSGLFLETPYIFGLEYIYSEGGQHPFLNKIKKCALTDLNVQYTPDGSYMTYKDGSMTSYSVSMTFAELSPIYAEDYKSTEDMGY